MFNFLLISQIDSYLFYSMLITLNNNTESFNADQLNITEILAIKNYSFKLIIVKLNNLLINKPEYESVQVKDGDDLKIIHLMSGG